MILSELSEWNNKTIDAFIEDLKQYYTGRATPSLLDRVYVEIWCLWKIALSSQFCRQKSYLLPHTKKNCAKR